MSTTITITSFDRKAWHCLVIVEGNKRSLYSPGAVSSAKESPVRPVFYIQLDNK